MRILGVICLPMLFVLSISPCLTIGGTSSQQEINIRVKTELIQLRAVVTDRQGQLIDSLSKEDFVLLEDGRPQPIAFFSLAHVGSETQLQRSQQKTAAPDDGKTAARSSSRSVPSRSMVLLVDTLHTSFPSLASTRAVLRHFLHYQMTEHDIVALVTPTGMLGVMEQFTQDRSLLKMGIERLFPWRVSQDRSLLSPFLAARIKRGDPDAAELAAQILADEDGLASGDGQGLVFDPRDRDRSKRLLLLPPYLNTRTSIILAEASYYRQVLLATIKAAVEKLGEMPGQRIIALFSEGFTTVTVAGEVASGELESTISRAARSGVVIYCFDARGLIPVMVPVWMQGSIANHRLVSYLGQSLQDSQDSLKVLAHETGGEAFCDTNDLAARVQKMLVDNQIYYELAYYPALEKDPKKLRRLSVSVVNHPEYLVRAQRSYLLSELREPKRGVKGQAPASELQKSMSRPLPVTDIGVIADSEFLAHEKDKTEIELQIQIQGENLQYRRQSQHFLSELELAVEIYDLHGKLVRPLNDGVQVRVPPEQLELARSRGYRFNRRMPIAPGFYHIRVGVRDIQSQRMGTAITWVEVPDLKVGKLILNKISLPAPALPFDKAAPDMHNLAKPEPDMVNRLRRFKRGESIVYSCMIYNAPFQNPDDDLKMQLEVFQGEQRIYLEPWFPVLFPSSPKNRIGIEIGGKLKLELLQPGVFELRAAIKTTKSNQKAQRALSFIVAP